MNYTQALGLISQSVAKKWLPSIVDHYHLENCSSNRMANKSRCCSIVLSMATDNLFDCDIRRIF